MFEGVVMATVEERLARLEGAYEHLATKADIKAAELRIVLVVIAMSGVIIGVLKFLP